MGNPLSGPQFIRGRVAFKLDSPRQVFADRRTKRERDRSTARRKSVERSKDEQ